MSVDSVIARVKNRLNAETRGDRGWFIITRVHVDAYWLKGIADYLFEKAEAEPMVLTDLDYANIAKIAGVASPNPGQQLRRHHLLVMDKPLGLIQRTDGRSWREIQLTWFGRKLASSTYFAPVLDQTLQKIGFAHSDAIPPDRREAYKQFEIWVFDALFVILKNCDGHIDRDEFNFFVSRVRFEKEIQWAIKGIHDYRETMSSLGVRERLALLQSLNALVHEGLSPKEYQNWRDVALHTFSLFDIGATMMRNGRELWLTSAWVSSTGGALVEAGEEAVVVDDEVDESGVKDKPAKGPRVRRALKIPVPPKDDDLLSPPVVAPALNSGVEAENLIAKILTSQGWRVVFYSNKRGYGFDLWASKDDVAMLIEVKSSTDLVGQINLTPTEYEAAKHHGANYVLAIVENAHDQEPQVWFVVDPANKVEIREAEELSYKIGRESWTGSAQQVF